MSFSFNVSEVSYNNSSVSSVDLTSSSVDTKFSIASSESALFNTKRDSDQVSFSLDKTNAELSETESAINKAYDPSVKEALIVKKEALLKNKAELEAKQADLKKQIDKVNSEMKAYETKMASLKAEINELNSKKSNYEKTINNDEAVLKSKNTSLKQISAQITASKRDLDAEVSELNELVKQTEDESSQELMAQRKAISNVTAEAMDRVQSGEMKAEDMPAFIAGQIGDFKSVGSTSKMSLINARNSKIKNICSNIGTLMNNKLALQTQISALVTKVSETTDVVDDVCSVVSSKEADLKSQKQMFDAKQTEKISLNTNYTSNATKIAGIDSEVGSLTTQIEKYEAIEAQAGSVQSQSKGFQFGQAPQTTSSKATSSKAIEQADFSLPANTARANANTAVADYSYLDDAYSKVQANYEAKMAQGVNKANVSEITGKMEEADNLVTTLRSKLTDEAQKLINERLFATKRR